MNLLLANGWIQLSCITCQIHHTLSIFPVIQYIVNVVAFISNIGQFDNALY